MILRKRGRNVYLKDLGAIDVRHAVSATVKACSKNNDLVDAVAKGGTQVIIDETCPAGP
jgi:hypothetical protein